jgi:hypothetical protein
MDCLLFARAGGDLIASTYTFKLRQEIAVDALLVGAVYGVRRMGTFIQHFCIVL